MDPHSFETAPASIRRRAALRAGAASLIALASLPDAQAAGTPILVLGDSLSAEYGLRRGTGWVALLEQRLRERGDTRAIINASISGETTAGGRTRIGALLARHRPGVLIVELGGNDALRGLDLAATEANLQSILRAARDAGARTLLLGMRMPPNYGQAYGERFTTLFPRLARSERSALVPFFLEGVGDRMELFQADRIHPNERAQATLLDNVWPELKRLL